MNVNIAANIEHETTIHRYELMDEGRVFGFIEYYLFDQVMMITHTEVNPSLKGNGSGSRLAGEAMEHVRRQGKRIVPICGFMVHYLRKNPQYHALVTAESRRIFGIGVQEKNAPTLTMSECA